MGKGFENYMSKKWFHPTNIENQKRKFLAEQKSAEEKKRQSDLREQYEREQEVFNNKQLMGDEKARLGLSFIYNAPASLKDQKNEPANDKKTDSQLIEEESAKNSLKSRDNLRCMKCKRIGHVNTDKVCPLYGKSRLDVEVTLDEESLTESKKQDDFKKPDIPAIIQAKKAKHSESSDDSSESSSESSESSQSDDSDKDDGKDEEELTLDMLRNLPRKEKKVLLKRLKHLAKKLNLK